MILVWTVKMILNGVRESSTSEMRLITLYN